MWFSQWNAIPIEFTLHNESLTTITVEYHLVRWNNVFYVTFFLLLFTRLYVCEGVCSACMYVNVCVYINVPLFRKLGDWSTYKLKRNAHILTIWNRNEISVKKTLSLRFWIHRKCVYNHLYLVKFNRKRTSWKNLKKRESHDQIAWTHRVLLMRII